MVISVAKRLVELAGKCTDGPWYPLKSIGLTGVHARDCKIYHISFDAKALGETYKRQVSDAEFIAFSRNHAPQLAQALLVAMDELDKLECLCQPINRRCTKHLIERKINSLFERGE